ncbi:MAG: MFS transporter [Thermoplasmatales archaeon]
MQNNKRFLSDFSGLSRNAKRLIVGSLFGNLALGLVFTDLSYFLHTVRGISIVYAGLLFTIEGISASALSIPLGIVSDKRGRKAIIVYGNVALGLGVLVLSFSISLSLLILAALIIGVGDAAFTSSQGAMLSELSSSEKRTAAFSFNSLVLNGAWACGGFMLYLISPLSMLGVSTLNAHLLLYISLGIATVASTAFFVGISENRIKIARKEKENMTSESKEILSKYVVSNLGIAVGAGLFIPLMSQWFNYKFLVPDTISGPILGISGAVIALSALIAPALGRRMGLINAMVVTMLSSTVFMVLIPLAKNFALSATFFIVRSLLMNVSGPLSTSLIMGIITSNQRGMASGITSIFFRMPNSFSSYLGSIMLKQKEYDLPFYMASILYIISIALFYYWFRNIRLPEEKEAEIVTTMH